MKHRIDILSKGELKIACGHWEFDPLGQQSLLEKEMATHSSSLAWEIPRIEEPGGLQSMGLQKIWTQLSD